MRGVVQRATRAYLRTGVVAVASAGLLAATFGVASGEDGAPIGPGTAKATAIVAQVAPGVGSLQLGITSGVAVAEIKNTLGQAQAKTLDLGLVGSTLTGESCGNAATISPSDLPQPTRVDSRGGKASLTEDQVPLPGTPLGVGHRVAEASPDPSAKAISDIVQTITGLIDISAGHAEASARAIKGQGREAEAKVSVDLTLAGAIKLSALNWDAYHRSGKDPKATASFDIGTGSLLGLPIPTESLASLETVLNSALEYTGLSITFPKVERFTQPADLIRMTPLTIELRNSQAGHDLLGPILDLTREQREQLFDQIAASFCQASAATLVGGIGLDIAAGSGFLTIELGGAEATTGDLVLESPFGPDEGGSVDLPSSDLGGGVPPGSFVTVPDGTAPPASVVQPAAKVGPLEDHCESAHPLRHTACSKGAALAVGLIGVLATAAVGALDWRHQRRRAARQEVPA
jgi:hypothetical protein